MDVVGRIREILVMRTCAVPSVIAVDAGRRCDGARLRVVVDGARPVAALPPHQRRLLAAEFDDDALNMIG